MSSPWLLNPLSRALQKKMTITANAMLCIGSSFIIVLYTLALFVYHNHTLIYIVYLATVGNSTIGTISGYLGLKHFQQVLNNAERIDDERRNKIRSAKGAAKALLIVCYIWIPMAMVGIFFILDFIFKFWDRYDQSLLNCIIHSVFWIFISFISIFSGFRIVNTQNERSLCHNCIKPGLRVGDIQEIPLLNRNTMDDMEQMHAR